MKNIILSAIGCLCILLAISCKKDEPLLTPISFDFSKQHHSWVAGFADYSDTYDDLDLKAEMAPLPASLNPSGKTTGFKVEGKNSPGDLFMFIKRKMTGLDPNQTYSITANIQFASDAPKGAIGIGGAPGEAVFLKAGAVAFEPKVSKNAQGTYVINVDKGNQGQSGKNMKIIGNVAKADDKPGYVSLVRKAEKMTVKTNTDGECWIIIGTDSGYEGLTRLYYQKIDLEITEVK